MNDGGGGETTASGTTGGTTVGGTADKKKLVIGVAALFLLTVAILLDLQYLYLMAVTLAVLPLASYLLARYGRPRLEIQREHAATAQEGRITPVTLYLRASGGLPLASLRVADRVPAGFTRKQQPVQTPDADGTVPPDTWDGQKGAYRYAVEPQKRGVYPLGPARAVTSDPLGLFTFERPLPGTSEIVVHPTPILAIATLSGGSGSSGVRESDGKTVKGEGMDFHGVREWREGDALRRVHWPTTARTGRLAVVEWERAYQRDLVIALDVSHGTSHGSGRETTLEYAIKVAATLIERTLADGGGVQLVTQAGREQVRAGESDRATARFRMFHMLARLRADAQPSLAEALRAARPPERSHFVLLTAWGDPLVSVYLAERMSRGDSVEVIFFEPGSFGGPSVMSPAVAGADFFVVTREHSPWKDGGASLAHLFRQRSY